MGPRLSERLFPMNETRYCSSSSALRAAEVEVVEVGDVSVVVGENRDKHRVERNGQTTKTGCVVDKADDAWKRV